MGVWSALKTWFTIEPLPEPKFIVQPCVKCGLHVAKEDGEPGVIFGPLHRRCWADTFLHGTPLFPIKKGGE